MKVINLILAGVVLLSLASCNSSERNKQQAKLAKDSLVSVKPGVIDSTGGNHDANTGDQKTVVAVRAYLQQSFKSELEKGIIDSTSRKFGVFEYDLNNDGKNEVFVGLTGSYFCGSGGCTWLLLDDHEKLLTRFTVSKYPVIISQTATNGWKDLIIYSNGKNHLVKFNGKKYPSNPSIESAIDSLPKDGLVKALDVFDKTY
ncbi:hypothetical protein [Pedobacter nutrimenti]|uniref:hypothetical protein n=1 Tax=Pedobacter nutrimenti TaxID=1241337 RepID=UPI002930BCB9|nr:hypothetical protein [Pedobacter nutrimenti]